MTAGKDSEILKRLEEWGGKGECSPEFLEFYQRLLRIQSKTEQHLNIPKPSLSSETINERIEHGLPLIEFDELALDWSTLQDIFAEVTATFADYPELFGEVPQSLREPRLTLTKEMARAWFEGVGLSSLGMINNANEALLEGIIHATLKPFLVSQAKALFNFVGQERWRRGYCPICGGSPDFAYLEKEYGARWLLCSRCDTEWLFQRLECPYCGTKDQNALAYYTDDEGLYRLYVCEQCKQYLKAIDLRQAKSEVLLPLERLFTLHVDRQAQEYGYSPCGKARAKVKR